ncbi:MAG: SDR family oxidoreductase [Dehalococcoidales bacterium]|nr:SDR family oxidoreductase [Dehalococcoidales bacterium]
MLLTDRVAIVTGGAVGIGRGIALKFAAEGCAVVVADISETGGKKTIEAVTGKGGKGLFVKCDVTSSAQINAMVDATIKEFGKLDILINNAGGVPGISGEKLEDVSEEEWDKFIDLNLKSAFLCCKAAVPHMKKNGYGKIVNFSSMGAIHPAVSVVHYHAAKGGVIGLTYNLAYELAPHNILVNAILPGPVRTPFWDPVLKNIPDPDAYFAEIGKREVPLGRIGTPEDIAGAALFLASDLSSFVTGDILYVAGGLPQLPQNATIAQQ